MSNPSYQVDRKTLLSDSPVLVVLAANLGFGLWALPRLPQQVPIHWGLNGQPNRFGSPWQAAVAIPLLAIGIYAAMLLVPLIDPRRNNYPLFSDFYRLLRRAVPLLLVAIHVASVAYALGYPVDPVFIVRLALPLLFLLIGNQLGQVRPNYFVGIRTPWTLASEEVWIRTHRAAARLWVLGSLLQFVTAFLPAPLGFGLFMGLVAIMVLVPVLYSYLLFRGSQR